MIPVHAYNPWPFNFISNVFYYWSQLLAYCTMLDSRLWRLWSDEWKSGRGNRSTLRKPTLVPLCPLQIAHGLVLARTRVSRWDTGDQPPELRHGQVWNLSEVREHVGDLKQYKNHKGYRKGMRTLRHSSFERIRGKDSAKRISYSVFPLYHVFSSY
jgi:hypothetical protein